MILGKTDVCKDVAGINGKNGKVGKNGTLMLNLSKLIAQTLHPNPWTPNPHLLTQTPTPNSTF